MKTIFIIIGIIVIGFIIYKLWPKQSNISTSGGIALPTSGSVIAAGNGKGGTNITPGSGKG